MSIPNPNLFVLVPLPPFGYSVPTSENQQCISNPALEYLQQENKNLLRIVGDLEKEKVLLSRQVEMYRSQLVREKNGFDQRIFGLQEFTKHLLKERASLIQEISRLQNCVNQLNQ